MLFGMVYTPRHSPEAVRSEGSLQLFTNWRPPVAFREHWNFATGGGMGLIEADCSAALTRCIAPFTPFFDFTVQQLDGDDEARPNFMPVPAAGSGLVA